jgi:hypothetical protein
MTRRRRRRRRRASSRFPFEGEGRRRGEDAVAPRDARLRCGSGEEGETTPERRRGWRTRVGGSPSRRPKKNRRIVHGGAFFDGFKNHFLWISLRGGRVSSLPISRLRKAGLRAHCARPAFCNRAPRIICGRSRPRRQKKAQVPVASKRERFDRAHTSPHAAASTWKRAPHALHHPHLSHARITAHERAPSETHERRRYARSAARSLLRVTPNQVVECQDERPRHRELVRRARHEEEEEEQGACRSCI